MALSIILPTYNESQSLEKLVMQLRRLLPGAEIIIVDDNSPDGTGTVADRLEKQGLVRTVHRKRRLGLASAVAAGFSEAKGEIIAVMDADLSHPAEVLPNLVREVEKKGADIAVASRLVLGGGVVHWPICRRLISRAATLLARQLTKVRDPLSGFFCVRRRVLSKLDFRSRGYKILLEILVKGRYRRVSEIPYVFRSRKRGTSKLGLKEYFFYCRDFVHLVFWKYL